MKRKDIGLIVVIGIISAAISFFVSSLIIPSSAKSQSVEVAEQINPEFDRPPNAYFNSDSVNPTKEIRIQQDPGSNPFEGN